MKTINENAALKPKPKRHFFVKVLIVLFLFIAWFGWLRFYNALSLWGMLQSIGLKVSPFYLAASGAFWGLLGLGCALCLFSGWRFAPLLAQVSALAAAAWYWVDRLWLSDPSAPQSNRLFAAALTLAFLAYTFSVFRLSAPRAFFERTPPDKE